MQSTDLVAMSALPGILLIDDDLGVREGLADLLASVAPVRTAGSWQSARRVLGHEPVGLVVTDYRLREDEGEVELLQEVRSLGVPMILCTGAYPSELQQARDRFRPDALLGKPFSLDEMMAAVSRLYRKAP